MYKVNNIEDLDLVYSILRERYPNNQVDITFNYNTKEYSVTKTEKPYKEDPEVPVDLNIEVVYGDSVTGDTPLLLRDPLTQEVFIKTIDELCDNWVDYPEFKIFDNSIPLEKQYGTSHFEIWCNKGWNQIKKVIKHKTNKKMYRVLTHTGVVDVTEDHSLLSSEEQKIKPSDVNVGTTLLHSFPSQFTSVESNMTIEKAFLYGFFFGDGNVDDTLASSSVYKLSITNPKIFVEEYRPQFYNKRKEKMVPNVILNGSLDIIQSFIDGYWAADGCRSDRRCDIKGKIGAQGLYLLLRRLDFNVSINVQDDKPDIYRLTFTKRPQRKCANEVKKITTLSDSESDYVYDIETEKGMFGAGVGQMVISNTDSIFIKFEYNRDNFEDNRQDTFKLATLCGNNLTKQVFNRPPIEMEFEKVFQPFILLTKKRYIAKKFEDTKDPFKLKGVDAKGVALTRRDYCNLVKKCYKDVIDQMMNANSSKQKAISDSIKTIKEYIKKIEDYQIDLEDVIITAQVAKDYSCKLCKKKTEWILKCHSCKTVNVSKASNCTKCKKPFACLHSFSLAHINLAQEMLKRNDDIQIGDRLSYAFVEKDYKCQKYDMAEDPKYIKEKELKLNRVCYLEQLAKPILGFMKVVLKDDLDILDELISYVNNKLILFGGKALRPSDFKIEE